MIVIFHKSGGELFFYETKFETWAGFGTAGSTENFCNSSFSFFPGHKTHKITVSVYCSFLTNKLINIFALTCTFLGQNSTMEPVSTDQRKITQKR